MLRPCYAEPPGQEKTPAAGRQTRERVGGELNSADTLTNYEEVGGTHPPTVAHGDRPVNPAGRVSCHPEGPSGALVVGDRDILVVHGSEHGVSGAADSLSRGFVPPRLANLDG
jgi:hypothetical protein